jgi:hypothetical protein
MSADIDLKRLNALKKEAEDLGYRIVHIHADVLKDPGRPRIKLELWQREKKA